MDAEFRSVRKDDYELCLVEDLNAMLRRFLRFWSSYKLGRRDQANQEVHGEMAQGEGCGGEYARLEAVRLVCESSAAHVLTVSQENGERNTDQRRHGAGGELPEMATLPTLSAPSTCH